MAWKKVEPQPLAAASIRIRKPRPRRKNAHLTVHQEGIAMGMQAVGIPQNKIAAGLGVPEKVIHNLNLEHPELKEQILQIRDKLKLTKMQKALFLEERMWNLVNDLVDDKDAKGVDGVMRAIHASEKIQQSVAGESIKIEQTGTPPIADLKILIQQLIQ